MSISTKQVFLMLLLLFSSNIQATKPKISISEALDLASNQQVLSQHLARVYVALCNNTMEPKFYQDRDATIQKFDEQLHILSQYIPSDKVKENIQNVRAIWKDYKEIAAWTIKKDAASKLLKQSTEILQAIKLLHLAYQEYEKTLSTVEENSDWLSINQYIKQTQNQEILIHRVIFNYLAEKQGIDATISGHQMDDAVKAFVGILDILEKAKITSKNIQAKLSLIRTTWTNISIHLVFVDKDQSYIDEMLNNSDIISKNLIDVTTLYKELGVKLSISHAINEATAQSMHIQQIGKSYIASSNDHLAYKYKKEVLEHLEDFEKTMESMIVKSPTLEVKNSLIVVQTLWKNYKKITSDFEIMDEVRVIKVLEQCHVLMAACDRVVEEVEYYAQTIPAYKSFSEKNGFKVDSSLDITRQIQLSSKLRINSHRVALYFMMTSLNLDNDVSTKRLNSCISDVDSYIKELKNSRLNSSPMTVLLESCSTEWDWIKSVSTPKDKKKEDIDLVLSNSDLLAKKLTKLTDLYEHKMNDLFAEDLSEESPSALKRD